MENFHQKLKKKRLLKTARTAYVRQLKNAFDTLIYNCIDFPCFCDFSAGGGWLEALRHRGCT